MENRLGERLCHVDRAMTVSITKCERQSEDEEDPSFRVKGPLSVMSLRPGYALTNEYTTTVFLLNMTALALVGCLPWSQCDLRL